MHDLSRNPARDNKTNIPKVKGNVRGQGDTFEYEDPMDDTWKPAVRLADIRARLIREAPPSLYTHEKECGYDPDDVTTFLAKDKEYGGQRQHRPALLFQIQLTGARGQKPTGYMKDGDRIVLDAFDHGIRDFPSILPKALSSELAGHDIMYYFRQNESIQLYDLIARQPNGYHEQDGKGNVTWHEGPPRYGTVGMRATRFRLQAGLLTWKKRMGSDTRNANILNFIPDECKDPQVNSTESFRDLTQTEQQAVAKVLLGSAPGRKRNTKEGEKGKTKVAVEDDDSDGEDVDPKPGAEDNVQLPTHIGLYISPNTTETELLNNNETSQEDEDSDSSSNESEEPLVKRRRAEGSTHSKKPHQNPAVTSSSVRRSSRRATLPSQQAAEAQSTSGSSDDEMNDSSKDESVSGDDSKRGEDFHSDSEENDKSNTDEAESSSSNHSSEKRPQRYLTQQEADVIQGPDPLAARLLNAAIINNQARPPQTRSPVKQLPDTTGTDFRTVMPNEYPDTLEDNIAAIHDALAITRFEFKQKVGFPPPASLIEENKGGSYAMQAHALQMQLQQSYRGPLPTPNLCILRRWEGSFRNWRVEGKEAQELWLAIQSK